MGGMRKQLSQVNLGELLSLSDAPFLFCGIFLLPPIGIKFKDNTELIIKPFDSSSEDLYSFSQRKEHSLVQLNSHESHQCRCQDSGELMFILLLKSDI